MLKKLVVLLIFMASSAHAGNGVGETTTTPAPRGGLAPPSNNSINQSASSGKSSQALGTAMNVATAGMMFAACPPHNYWACAMGALALAQAAADRGAGRGSGATYDASLDNPYGTGEPPPGFNDPNDPNFTTGNPDVDSQWNNLRNSGWSVTRGGIVKGPDGKTYKPEDFKSQDSMVASGMSPSAASAAAALIAKANKAAADKADKLDDGPRVVGMELDGGAGGGGGRDPASEESSFDDYLKKLRNPFGINEKQREAMVAGKAKSVGDDSIGVSVDDIFRMVHRRYQERRAINDFIENAATATNPSAAAPSKPLMAKPAVMPRSRR